MQKFLLYGATGYTAGLVIKFAKEYGLTPILAGRNQEKMDALAESTGLECRVFPLSLPAEIDKHLEDIDVVSHCAGPFEFTAKSMMEACIRNKVHYLDITGEIEVFELGASLDEAAKAAGICIMPGTGFDVVPSDCMAAYLAPQMPDATHLELAIASEGGRISHGTATTAIENLGQSGAARINGLIQKVDVGHKQRWFNLGEKKRFGASIPWGDVSTAFHTTGIPNILVYMAMPPKQAKSLKWAKTFGFILRQRWLKNYLIKKVKAQPAGPTSAEAKTAKSYVWGEVRNGKGETRQAWFEGPEGYFLTAHTNLMILKEVLAGNVDVGFQTPGKAFGPDFILKLAGTKREDLKS